MLNNIAYLFINNLLFLSVYVMIGSKTKAPTSKGFITGVLYLDNDTHKSIVFSCNPPHYDPTVFTLNSFYPSE